MTKDQKKQFQKEALENIQEWLDVLLPAWTEPYVSICSESDGLYVSLTEECEYAKIMPWKEFEDDVLDHDIEVVEKYLPKFKKLIRKMEILVSEFHKTGA